MLKKNREIKYSQALNEAVSQTMEEDEKVFVMGEGVDYKNGIFGSTSGLVERFGQARVFDIPLAEDAMTGIGIGSALLGMKPIMVHARIDFLMLTMNQLVNHAAKWPYMCGGNVPIVVRAIIGRGWGQGPQHSQSLQALFAHIPGLKVIMPVTPHDAKGMLVSAIKDSGPVICLEHRWLYDKIGEVLENIYEVPIGKGRLEREGRDVTIVAVSQMVLEAAEAANYLQGRGISAEVIDLRTVRPIDGGIVCNSVKKTGRLVIADTGWKACGISAEVAAIAVENVAKHLKANIVRIALPDLPTPTAFSMDNEYYPGRDDIINSVLKMFGAEAEKKNKINISKQFKGSF
ncbi:MAG: Transketolase domain protein [Candidatus Magasanikbacteria bacterium GW2011_GWA2_42_32]|uniref:Transketolase domain protein n=1 Tax=Candidatus Magasanikbacteria bacterium GW2011_GWA2_42_32 TaxID=1619039 RepID=A0A0G1A6K5_9BACT|nr:MAG: Transketolase domain protein [Candidatus Magasanikbacteria bacterium GW2011_GWA2_42_32]